MMLDKLIGFMADGEFHSGAELGELLGVSRTAVWKHLQKLEALGLDVESVKGRGYRLSRPVELLSASHIESRLTPSIRARISELDIHQVLESTNDTAMARIAAGRAHGYVCLAECQTAGKGRRGRRWVSPYGKGVFLSTVVEYTGGAAVLDGLSLAVSVGLLRALKVLGVADVQVKWPNDLLWQQRKLAGILLEMVGDPAGVCQVVIGVGINVGLMQSAANAIDQPWTELHQLSGKGQRNVLVAAVLSELLPIVQDYAAQGFVPLMAEWQVAHAFHECEVVLSSAGRHCLSGRVVGVSTAGALLLQTTAGVQPIHGGELSLREAADVSEREKN